MGLVFRVAYNGLTPSSGLVNFPTTVIDALQFTDPDPDPADADKTFSGSVSRNIGSDSEPLIYELGAQLAGPADATIGGSVVFDAWTGASKTGSQFTVIGEDTDFGGETSLEVKVFSRRGRFQFSKAQRDYHSVTTVYVDAQYSHTVFSAARDAEERAFLIAVANYVKNLTGGGASPTTQATAGENLSEGLVYVGPDGLAYQLDDPSDRQAVMARGWLESAKTTGQLATIILSGNVTPSSYDPPIGLDLFVGSNNLPTYHGDGDNPLSSGDYYGFIGKSYDGVSIEIECRGPVTGREP